jgi:protocatechuate 3,4-dioxygenase beta subunit
MNTPSSHIEIVALATDQASTLTEAVERLHHHLRTELAEPWTLTIVDYASHDDTLAVAQRLVGRFVSTQALRLPERMDRKALRQLAGERIDNRGLSRGRSRSRHRDPTRAAHTRRAGRRRRRRDKPARHRAAPVQPAAFALDLVVIDVATQKPIQGAAVDTWHADANGAYSGFVAASAPANGGGNSSSGSDTSTFLRGTQLTDASGKVSFATIYPGWYTGRTVHIHVKVHVSGKEIHTGQLFFDDTFTDALYAGNTPYSTRSARNVRNASDSIFSGGGAQSTLVVQKASSGYAATMNMGVKAS